MENRRLTEQEQLEVYRQAKRQRVGLVQRAVRRVQSLSVNKTEFIDISHWQSPGQLDFSAMVETHPGVIIRATNGSVQDTLFSTHWPAALEAGMGIAVYHYFQATQNGSDQAQNILATIQPLVAALGYKPRIAIDVEAVDGVPNSTRLIRLQTCLQALEAAGFLPGIYSSPGFANSYLSPAPGWINNYWQWVAHYTSAAMPTNPAGWSNVKAWQYGIWDIYPWALPVPGSSPDIDKNKFFGTREEFLTFLGVADPGQPPPTIDCSGICKRVITNNLNIRSGPGTQYQKIGTLNTGDIVKVLDIVFESKTRLWLKIDWKEKNSYCAALYDGSQFVDDL